MKTYFYFWLVLAFFLFFSSNVSAQRKHFTAKRINPASPVIDGKLNDEAWESAQWGGDFTQYYPYNGNAPSEPTEFTIMYDDQNLYLAIKAHDSEPNKIDRRVSRRDEIGGDHIAFQIDSYFDKRTAFVFVVTAAGVRRDLLASNDGETWDENWDAVWDAAVSHDDNGWNAELKIPLSQLRFSGSDEQTWGLQVVRRFFRKQEFSHWQFIPRGITGWQSHYGELNGITGIKSSKRIEVLPYTVSKVRTSLEVPGNPFADGMDGDFLGGFDAKMGLTNNLTLDITVNPDFGQVEADPSEVNLTTFETFFPEKRPFFIEGNNIFKYDMLSWPSEFLFHSRRIGKSPSYLPSTRDGEYADNPDNSSILAAVKLTGKTENGYSIGILESVTQKEKSTLDFQGSRHDVTVEPLTNYFAGRLQKDYDEGNMIVGGMLTAVNRNIEDAQLNFLSSAAYTGGLDIDKFWQNKKYQLQLKSSFSHIRGSKNAISAVQRSPLRYFQRSDADHVTLDPNKTSLTGHGGNVRFFRSGSERWSYQASYTWRSPEYELNDMGFQRRADFQMFYEWIKYREWKPMGIFNSYDFTVSRWDASDFGRNELFDGTYFGVNAEFKNFWTLFIGNEINGEVFNRRMLRGGSGFLLPKNRNHTISVSTDRRRKYIFSVSNTYESFQDDASSNNRFTAGLTFHPLTSLNASLSTTYAKNDNRFQYLNSVSYYDDTRFILGTIDQNTLSVTARINYGITPSLSLQYYGQPFLSSGSYSQFKYVTDGRASRLSDRFQSFSSNQIVFDPGSASYTIDENTDGTVDYSFRKPDFNVFEFNSNFVLRWEYSPGSTVFFVWTQDRNGFESGGDFSVKDDFRNVFSFHPNNVFLIKVNRWFSF